MSRFSMAFIVAVFLLNSNLSEAKTAAKTLKKGNPVTATASNPIVILETNKGPIEIELWADKAPITVKNFLTYVDEKFYDETVFHRVIPKFMIQGGGMTVDMKEKSTHESIKNEASSELANKKGTLAMARTSDINSASSQFFINLVDNGFLDHTGTGPQTFGYAVFGNVTKGMETVDAIAKVTTGNSGYHQDVPQEAVIIKSARRK